MYIIPMTGITPLETISQNAKPIEETTGSASFVDVFKQALENVQETSAVCEADSVAVTLGEVDDLHTVQINMQKAAVALEVFVAMKNTAVDSYKQIMQMSI